MVCSMSRILAETIFRATSGERIIRQIAARPTLLPPFGPRHKKEKQPCGGKSRRCKGGLRGLEYSLDNRLVIPLADCSCPVEYCAGKSDCYCRQSCEPTISAPARRQDSNYTKSDGNRREDYWNQARYFDVQYIPMVQNNIKAKNQE